MDYGRPEIRDLAFRFVEEVCRNYDVDGVELDFVKGTARDCSIRAALSNSFGFGGHNACLLVKTLS